MVDKIIFYKDLTEKRAIISREQGLGFNLIHDDFVDDKGNETDGKSGRLTFSDANNAPTKEQLTRTQVFDRIAVEYIKRNDIEEI